MTSAIRLAKLQRLTRSEPLRVLELCSGCGGMSLGLHAAGLQLVGHVEQDPTASATYARNFLPPEDVDAGQWQKPRDMVECSPEELAKDLGLPDASGAFDVLAAGLPCQAFARIGRSKLRSVAGDDDAYRNDPRARLYRRFLEYVTAVQPVVIVIENVPDILNFGGHNVPEEICETLDGLGYETSYTLLNSAFYGVPQMRERLFLIAYDRSLGVTPTFPHPSHAAELPSGYDGARAVALKFIPETGSHFHPIPVPAEDLPGAVSTRAALSDLPFISEHFRDPGSMRRRKLGEQLSYRSAEISGYARRMREWPGFESPETTDGHLVRLTPRDFPIFRRMPSGADYPRALGIAEQIFEEALLKIAVRPPNGSEEWNDLRARHVPPYDPGKFPNKWWKLEPTSPSRTLTAHLGKDSYSHIHWDSRQQRTISVREAARLQSFPDGFRFAGAMNAGFRQIGNAVPPMLALAIGQHMRHEIEDALRLRESGEGNQGKAA
ncbi:MULTISPECIES: DNA cytosine methyltransferase [Rhizobium/Agrobacterium group]|uniref:DNA (cytosine-5-)-methyltransferase n=2 Tax=Rhizobium/Agrobacterium group TaxID=227290 RepID=B9JXJ9_ALLAM|nr:MULTISPECIES: DNA cytosine methyltransferase [Rhizobium/Agrobacterium group]ACM36976.1 DNA methylase [Allorhizobium ampelinum S4]MUO42172.1 DNA (cytosine-5-)-methyltransferase [Agrobacterium vitis]MUP10913.1 DNA (cytosine-5-)-methyltransferase [Agrobacterium vitis]